MGKLRAEQGHPKPWTETIGRIYLEYVDEAWNYPTWAYPFDPWHPDKYAGFAKERFNAVRASKYNSPKFTFVLNGQLADDYWVNDPIDKLAYPSHHAMDAAPYMDSFTTFSTPLNELHATVLDEDLGHTKTLLGTMKIWASRGEKTQMLVYEGGPGSLSHFPTVADEVRKNSMTLATLSIDSIADLFANGIGEYNLFIYQNSFGWQVTTGSSSRFRLPIWYASRMFNSACADRAQVETKAPATVPMLKVIAHDKDGKRLDGDLVPAISVRTYLKKDRKSFLVINRNPQVEYSVSLQTQDNDVTYRVTTLAATSADRGTLEGPGLVPIDPSERDLSKIFEAVQAVDENVKSVQGNVKVTLPPASMMTVRSGSD
jgi:hypothetical protein